MRRIGRHLLVELWACDPEALANETLIRRALRESTDACGDVLLRLTSYKFTPGGVTGAAVISKSHIAIHTWPEHQYAAVDVFTCGDDTDPYVVVPVFRHALRSEVVQTVEVPRGVPVAMDCRVVGPGSLLDEATPSGSNHVGRQAQNLAATARAE